MPSRKPTRVPQRRKAPNLPDNARLLPFHRRLLERDETAPNELVGLLWPHLWGYTRAKFPSLDDDAIWEATSRTLLQYCQAPQGFDPAKGSLLAYLRQASWGDAANLLKKQGTRRRIESSAGRDRAKKFPRSVADDPLEGNLLQDEFDFFLGQLPDPADRRFLELRRAGGGEVSDYAAALGLGHLSPAQQKAAVKRARDRINKMLQRGLSRREAPGRDRETP